MEKAADGGQTIKKPILFLFESPQGERKKEEKKDPYYQKVPYGGCEKFPPRKWFWLPENSSWPDSFEDQLKDLKGRVYGEMIRALIHIFGLENCYVTNLVKCGMNNERGDKFRNLNFFPEECWVRCAVRFLFRESAFLEPKLIVAFGSATFDRLKKFNNQELFEESSKSSKSSKSKSSRIKLNSEEERWDFVEKSHGRSQDCPDAPPGYSELGRPLLPSFVFLSHGGRACESEVVGLGSGAEVLESLS